MMAWWGFIVFIWLAAAVLGGLWEGIAFGDSAPPEAATCDQLLGGGWALHTVLNFDVLSFRRIDLFGFTMQLPWLNTCWIRAAAHLGTWQFVFIPESYNMLRLVFLVLTSITMMGILITVGPIALALVQTIRNLFRV